MPHTWRERERNLFIQHVQFVFLQPLNASTIVLFLDVSMMYLQRNVKEELQEQIEQTD